MADDDSPAPSEAATTGSETASLKSDTPPPATTSSKTPQACRAQLITQARAFLNSPAVRNENSVAKRRFLIEKGLSDGEIHSLMAEQPMRLPDIPPRTYPQPPPSNLPHLLMGVARIFTWLAGGSAVLILLYYRFILPRLTSSANFRRGLKEHHASLLTRLNKSLASLKEAQRKTFPVLPQPRSRDEGSRYTDVHTLAGLKIEKSAPITVQPYTVLRCLIESLEVDGKRVTSEEMFDILHERYMWLKTEDGLIYAGSLWRTLKNNPAFDPVDDGGRQVWIHKRQSDPPEDAVMASLQALKSAIPPERPATASSPYQYALQALADLTGYVSTQTYSFGAAGLRVPGLPSTSPLNPQEEQIRQEIRSLKGLVLNRRTFTSKPASPAPSIPSTLSSPGV